MSHAVNDFQTNRPGSMLEYQQKLLQMAGGSTLSDIQEAFVAVRLGQQHWLVDLSNVQEALAPPRMARIASAPRWVSGVVGVRGQVWSVIDMLALSPDEGSEPTPRSRGWMTLLRDPPDSPGQRIALLWSDMVQVSTKRDYAPLANLPAAEDTSMETIDPVPASSDLPAWVRALWQDPSGQVWRELDVDQILGDRGLVSSLRQRVDLPVSEG